MSTKFKFHAIVQFLGENAPNLIKKGESHMEAKHVMAVTFDADQGHLSGRVHASFKKKLYKVVISLDKTYNIVSSQCECPNGQARCGHMSALLIWAHHNISSTDTTCSWAEKKCSDESVVTINDLYDRAPYEAFGSSVLTLPSAIDEKAANVEGAAGLKFLLQAEPDENEDFPEGLNSNTNFSFLKFAEDVIRSDGFELSNDKLSYVKEHMGVSWENVCALARATVRQAADPLWTKARACRLTASNFGKIFKNIISKKQSVSLLRSLLNPQNLDRIKPIMWGRNHESTAAKAFSEETGLAMQKTGLWLHECGFLGASPDGLVGDDAVIEIKCPFSLRNSDLYVALDVSKPDSVKNYIIYFSENKWILNCKHEYYHQIMAQMAFTKRHICYLVVWTTKSVVSLRVLFYPEWIDNISLLQDFYINQFAPFVRSQ